MWLTAELHMSSCQTELCHLYNSTISSIGYLLKPTTTVVKIKPLSMGELTI